MKITCPNCQTSLLVFLNEEPIHVLKNGIDCIDCNSKINFNIMGNVAMVSKKTIAPKKFVFSKPSYQMKQIRKAIYA